MSPVAIFGMVVVTAFAVVGLFWRKRRSRPGPENNWTNDAYAAREESGTWSESENAPGHDNRAAPSILKGLGL